MIWVLTSEGSSLSLSECGTKPPFSCAASWGIASVTLRLFSLCIFIERAFASRSWKGSTLNYNIYISMLLALHHATEMDISYIGMSRSARCVTIQLHATLRLERARRILHHPFYLFVALT